jgi:murein DD-endopeptidase MepM/ murein hydrolase activator NlpD
MSKKLILIVLTAFSWSFASAETPRIEIRFCPASAVRTYPLESRREVNSLLLPNAAVLNQGGSTFKIKNATIELLQSGKVTDSRQLDAAALQRFADQGAKMQAGGVLKEAAFQFCGDRLIPPDVKLAGLNLETKQALLITSQVFAFRGARDSLRVNVEGEVGGKVTKASGTLPINSEFAKNVYIFPLRGVSYVGWGASFHTGHRWAFFEEFALDIARIGSGGLTHKGDGTRFEDYYAYGADVLAAADGRVTEADDNQPEDPTAMQRPDESQEAYFARLLKEQAGRMAKGKGSILGNYVMIDHGKSEFAMYAHLQPGSVRVHKGDQVKAGDVIGKLGSSGNSTEPHLHFHVCDSLDPWSSASIPVNFSNITVQWADVPRPIQSGDIIIAK